MYSRKTSSSCALIVASSCSVTLNQIPKQCSRDDTFDHLESTLHHVVLLYRAKHPEHHMLTLYMLLQAASDIEEEMAEMDSAADSDEEEARASLKVKHKPTALFRVATTTKCIVQNAENVFMQRA